MSRRARLRRHFALGFVAAVMVASCSFGDTSEDGGSDQVGDAATTSEDQFDSDTAASAGDALATTTTTSSASTTEVTPSDGSDDPDDAELRRFLDVSAGRWHICGVVADGTLTCWGTDRNGSTNFPAGTYVSVSSASDYSCAVSTDAAVNCWGHGPHRQTDAPGGAFSSVSTGDFHACGVRTDTSVSCWGAEGVADSYPIDPPQGSFSKVSAGSHYTCGLRADRTIDCWGDDTNGELGAPHGAFIDVTAARRSPCAIRDDGALVCWGRNAYSGHPFYMDGPYTGFMAESDGLCATNHKHSVFCRDSNDRMSLQIGPQESYLAPRGGSFVAYAKSQDESCGISPDRTLTCSGIDYSLLAAAPDGDYLSVSVEELYSCAVGTDHRLACWGYEAPWWRGEQIPDELSEVSVAANFACGITLQSRSAPCWGRVPMGSIGYGEIRAIAPGDRNVCAVRSHLTIDCTYDNYRGTPPVLPDGSFIDVSSGGAYFCAVGEDGAITCWEDDELSGASFDITPPPGGVFVSVAAGETHACALRNSGSAQCWGSNDHGQSEPPEADFVAIDVAEGYSCGITQDGDIECWGAPPVDKSWTPEGAFVDVSTASKHACVLRTDATLACWFTHFVPRPDGVIWE